MNTNMKRLLSLLLALMMLIPTAMAETDAMSIVQAYTYADTAENEITLSAQATTSLKAQISTKNISTADNLSDDMFDHIAGQLHRLIAVVDEENFGTWSVPFLELDSCMLYCSFGDYMWYLLDGATPDGWVISDFGVDNYETGELKYESPSSSLMIFSTQLDPSTETLGLWEEEGDLTGYGFCYTKEDGKTYVSLTSANLTQGNIDYTVEDESFFVGSPVFTEDGMLIGVADGSTNVYSALNLLVEFAAYLDGGETAEEPAEEPEDEPTEKPTEEPADEPAEEPAEEPADEPAEDPTEAPTKKPAKEPEDEPEEDEDDEPAPAAKDGDDGIDKNLIYGAAAVVVVAALYIFNKRKKDAAKKAEAQPAAAERPKYNAPASTPKYTPSAQDGAVTQPAGDIPATVLVTPPAAKRTVVGIRCVSGAQAGATYRLEREVRIGRDPKRCSIILPKDERGISGLHCSVEPTSDGAIRLTDLGSSYGTFVNGQKLAANTPRILRAGERFQLADGNNRFEVFTEEI